VHGELVSGDFFETLGVGAALGRTLQPSDDTARAQPVAVLGHGYWQTAFGGDAHVVGKTVLLNKVPVTIVGVAPSLRPPLKLRVHMSAGEIISGKLRLFEKEHFIFIPARNFNAVAPA
jgi:hypothetical protein